MSEKRVNLSTDFARNEDQDNADAAQKKIEDHLRLTKNEEFLADNAVGKFLYVLGGTGYRVVPSGEINDLRNLRDAIRNVLLYPPSRTTLEKE